MFYGNIYICNIYTFVSKVSIIALGLLYKIVDKKTIKNIKDHLIYFYRIRIDVSSLKVPSQISVIL